MREPDTNESTMPAGDQVGARIRTHLANERTFLAWFRLEVAVVSTLVIAVVSLLVVLR